uniref:Uncharacterized protein n=1 Tax=Arundo donax TaxID=35708 RepID=A0A0A9FLB6_ARUDO
MFPAGWSSPLGCSIRRAFKGTSFVSNPACAYLQKDLEQRDGYCQLCVPGMSPLTTMLGRVTCSKIWTENSNFASRGTARC